MKFVPIFRSSYVLIFSIFLPIFSFATAVPPTSNSSSVRVSISQTLGNQPLSFTENKGQWDDRVLYQGKAGNGMTYFFERDGFTLLTVAPDKTKPPILDPREASLPEEMRNPLAAKHYPLKGHALNLRFVRDPNQASPQITATDFFEWNNNYFLGNDEKKWAPDCKNAGKLEYKNVWNGIDVVYRNNNRQLEYDIVVQPGANPASMKFRYDGLSGAIETVDNGKAIQLPTSLGNLREEIPGCFQIVNGMKRDVRATFTVFSNSEFGFAFPDGYDSNYPLTIDPLVYSTYLGGSNSDELEDIASDGSGGVYVVGLTLSSDFPTTAGALDPTFNTYNDVFISHLNSTGSALLFSTYLGGVWNDCGYGITVSAANNIYITGTTESNLFPTTTGAYDQTYNGTGDIFVSKLNSTGNALLFSTFVGGNSSETPTDIYCSPAEAITVSGYSSSSNFPMMNSYDDTFNGGGSDGILFRLINNGATLINSTYIGGSGFDAIDGIDNKNETTFGGSMFACGRTTSTDFPTTTDGYDRSYNGGTSDGFAFQFNNNYNLVYGTYIGGSSLDYCSAISADGTGGAYLTGSTTSSNFPTTMFSTDRTYNGDYDSYLISLGMGNGVGLQYGTYLGGSNLDMGEELYSDHHYGVTVVGSTSSTDFPTTENAYDRSQNGGSDIFVTRIGNVSGNFTYSYSSFLGGSADDQARAIAYDGTGGIIVAGKTNGALFPTSTGALDPSWNGNYDGVVARIDHLIPPNAPTALNASSITSTSISGTFTDNSTYETGFKVYYSTYNSAYYLYGTIPAHPGTGIVSYSLNLLPSLRYDIHIYAMDGDVYSNSSDLYMLYTLPAVPAAPTLGIPGNNSIPVTVNNNATTPNTDGAIYAIRVNGSQWVQADGSLGSEQVFSWQLPYQTQVNVIGLTPFTQYTFEVVANNGYGSTSGFSPPATCWTTGIWTPHTDIFTPSTGVLPATITDNSTVNIPIYISDTREITDLDIRISATHNYVSDVSFVLVHPNGTTIATLIQNRGATGRNFNYMAFDDGAGSSISGATAPFTGVWQPESPLFVFNGLPANGTWLLRCIDRASPDAGTVTSIEMAFASNTPRVPSNPYPTIGQTNIGATPTLMWDCENGTSYNVYFGTDNPPTNIVSFEQSPNSYTITTPLTDLTTYFWKIVAFNSYGSTEGPVWSFTTTPTPDYRLLVESTGATGCLGGSAMHLIVITNTGTLRDSITDIFATSPLYACVTDSFNPVLLPGESVTIPFRVDLRTDATVGDFVTTTVSVTTAGHSEPFTGTVTTQVTPANTLPLIENFSSDQFPPQGWSYINLDNSMRWVRFTGYHGNDGAAMMDCYHYNVLETGDALVPPPVTTMGISTAFIEFDWSYTPLTGYSDTLTLLYSNFTLSESMVLWSRPLDGQSLAAGTNGSTSYPGEDGTWGHALVQVPSYLLNRPTVQFQFVVTNGHGSAVFLDNVKITEPSMLVEADTANGYLGGSAMHTLRITNTGTQPDSIVDLFATSPLYAVATEAYNRVVLPNQTVTVRFRVDILDTAIVGDYVLTEVHVATRDHPNPYIGQVVSLVQPAFQLPLFEDFSSTQFPPEGWSYINLDNNLSWSRYSGYHGNNGVAMMDCYHYNISDQSDHLALPPISTIGVSSAQIEFDWSYSPYSSFSDTLILTYHNMTLNESFELWVRPEAGSSLAAGSNGSTSYPAEDGTWGHAVVQIPSFLLNRPTVHFKFVAVNGNGSSIFIDNVKISAPMISVTPDPLDFGTSSIGHLVSRNLTISNSGIGSLIISRIDITGDGFGGSTVSNVSIPFGSSFEYPINWTPNSIGVSNGTAVITHNGLSSPTTVNLVGVAISPPTAPQNLSVTYTSATQTAFLSWTQSSGSVSGYNVYRYPTGYFLPPTVGTLVGTTNPDSPWFYDNNVTVKGFYRVTAFYTSSGSSEILSIPATTVRNPIGVRNREIMK